MVNSIADSLPASRKLEKSWITVSIHNEPAIMIQISLQISFPFSELPSNAIRLPVYY